MSTIVAVNPMLTTKFQRATPSPHVTHNTTHSHKRKSAVGRLASMAGDLEREFRKSFVYRQIKRTLILLVGGTVLLIGIAMIVLPGPAFIVVPAGLSVLALEFAWARRWMKKARDLWRRTTSTVSSKK